MQPLDPKTKEHLIKTRNAVSPEDIEEYERLQSARFRREPSAHPISEHMKIMGEEAIIDEDTTRLEELTRKLFGPEDTDDR